jgi:hypothetical protein
MTEAKQGIKSMSVIELNDKPVTDQQPAEKAPVFAYKGTTYYIEKKPRVNLTLRYLKARRERGPVEAEMDFLPEILGDELMDVLISITDLSEEDFAAVAKKAAEITMGGLDKALGNSNSGPSN